MGPGKTIKRTELYRLLWTEPVTRLARLYGLSDVGFAKLCKRYDIPRPPRGYWAQRQHGQEPEQVPLPKPEHDPEIDMGDRPPRSASSDDADAEEPPQI